MKHNTFSEETGWILIKYIYFTNGCKHTGVRHHLKQ